MASGQQQTITAYLGILAILFAVPVLFYETTESLVRVWITNETFTHGFLIFPITAYLIYQRKNSIDQQSPTPEPIILILLLPILGAWLISNLIEVQVTQQLSMIAIIPTLVWLFFGRKILLLLVFPMFYLFFSVPFGQTLIPPMMEFTADFTVSLVKLTGIPIYREGLYFSLPSGNWSVVEECSGVRYMIASVALGSVFAYLSFNSNIKRFVFIAFALLLPVLANGIRAFGIVMIGHASNMKMAAGADHLLYGWIFFGIVMTFMFYIGSLFWEPVTRYETTQAESVRNLNVLRSTPVLTIAGITLASILSIQLIADSLNNLGRDTASNVNLSISDHFEGWQYNKNLSLHWNPIIVNADALTNKSYQYGDEIVQLNIGFFSHQRHGAEAVSSQNKLTDPYNGQWKVIHSTDLKDENIFITETTIQRMGQKLLVWSWFQVGSFQTPNAYIAKLFEAYNQVVNGRKDAAFVTISTSFNSTKKDARTKLQNFIKATAEPLRLAIDQAVSRD